MGDIMKKEKLIKISVTGVFCALAFILTAVLRFKVAFLSFDLKDTVIAVVSLMYGPIYGVVSAGIVAFLEFLSVTACFFLSFGCLPIGASIVPKSSFMLPTTTVLKAMLLNLLCETIMSNICFRNNKQTARILIDTVNDARTDNSVYTGKRVSTMIQ